MSRKKLSKQQIREKQALEDKKFSKNLRKAMIGLMVVAVLVNIFYIHWCDTKFFIRKHLLFGKKINPCLVCESDDNLKYHNSNAITLSSETYYVCSAKCQHLLSEHFNEYAKTIDALTGDSILKAKAIIGLKVKGESPIVYFKNEQNFKNYYETNTSK